MKKNGRYKIKKIFLSILISFLCLLFCGTALTIPAEAKIWIKLADATKYQKYTMEKPVFPEETTTKKPSSSSSGSSSSGSSSSGSSGGGTTSSSSGSSSGAEKKPSVLDKKDCSACSGGRCSRCGGTGKIKRLQAGTRKRVKVKCTSCRPAGSGKCYSCKGKGEK